MKTSSSEPLGNEQFGMSKTSNGNVRINEDSELMIRSIMGTTEVCGKGPICTQVRSADDSNIYY